MVLFNSILINSIIYIFLMFPLFILLFIKNLFSSKKAVLVAIAISFVIESTLSTILYSYGKNIFSIFAHSSGVLNLSIFISKIIFIDSSLYGIKVLIPYYLFKTNKKTVVLVLSKTAVSLFFYVFGYFILPFTFFLYLFPICNIIYYIIIITVFLKYF